MQFEFCIILLNFIIDDLYCQIALQQIKLTAPTQQNHLIYFIREFYMNL